MYSPQVLQWHWWSTCIAYGCMDHQQNPPIAFTWAIKGRRSRGERRHGWQLWRERGRRWVLPLEMRLLLSKCQNSLEEPSQPLYSPWGGPGLMMRNSLMRISIITVLTLLHSFGTYVTEFITIFVVPVLIWSSWTL